MANSVTPSYVLASNGPLTSIFNPQSHCLYTTTSLNNQYFLGYIPEYGTDSGCYPSGHPITPTPTNSQPSAITIQAYSPGVCPSGWSIVQPFFTSITTAGAHSSTHRAFASTPPANTPSTFLCCPSGYTIGVSSAPNSLGVTLALPLCSTTTHSLWTAWHFTSSGWPTSTPATYHLFKSFHSSRSYCYYFSVTASALAIAWAPSDTLVAEYNQQQAAQIPWPPLLTTPNASCVETPTKIGIIVSAMLLIPTVFLGCCCWARMARRRQRNKLLGLNTAGNAGTVSMGRGEASGELSEDMVPLTMVEPAHVADHEHEHERLAEYARREQVASPALSPGYDAVSPGRQQQQQMYGHGQTDIHSSLGDEMPPPRYDEVLRMGDENLDLRGPQVDRGLQVNR